MTTPSQADYLDAVRAAVGDLPADLRDDLLDDLSDHLAEVAAEAGDAPGALVDRLGDPIVYAQELRDAAGFGEPATTARLRLSRGLAAALHRGAGVVRRADQVAGRAVGYARLRELFSALRPAWWVVRGWVAAQFFGGLRSEATWPGLLPRFGGSAAVGAVVTVACVVLSVWLGRHALGAGEWLRRTMLAASAAALVGAVAIMAWAGGGTDYVYVGPVAGSYDSGPYGSVPSSVTPATPVGPEPVWPTGTP